MDKLVRQLFGKAPKWLKRNLALHNAVGGLFTIAPNGDLYVLLRKGEHAECWKYTKEEQHDERQE